MKLWYEKAAERWTEALPLGNGHMGAMAYGGTNGLFELSENSCWAGAPQEKYVAENAGVFMREARKRFAEKNISEGEKLLSKCCGIKKTYGTQLPMGRLLTQIKEKEETTYRELDLLNGTALDICRFGETEVTRSSFISNLDHVMCIRLSAAGAKMPELCVWLEGWSQPSHTEYIENTLTVKGRALENLHSDGLHGVEYFMKLKFITDGKWDRFRQGIAIQNATYLTIFLAAGTNMFTPEIESVCDIQLQKAERIGYEQLYSRHIREHASWMSRCELYLEKTEASFLPTDQRIQKYKEGGSDQDLIALYFQYGRYLLLNTSRPDSMVPAALQGVWNDDRACRMCWTDDMHLDINTQMNYYPAHVTGLGECTGVLFRWIKNILMPNGEQIAKQLYGADGWTSHTVSNAFGWAAPGWDGCSWAFNMSSAGWLSAMIWEHYLYTKDEQFLKEYYDVIYGCAQFLYFLLTEDPETGELVTNPSYSPENAFYCEGKIHHITTGSTADTNITKYIFQALQEAARVLKCEDSFTKSLPDVMKRLPKFKIGKYGQLMEWNEDYEFPVAGHVSLPSHLLALHPFHLIDPEKSPELIDAIKKVMENCLKSEDKNVIHTNWGGALLILFYARLLDGQAALKYVEEMGRNLTKENMMFTHIGPENSVMSDIYELDGNTGFTAGIAEMLVYEHGGTIHVLPALPEAWRRGEYKGLIVYGGHIIDAQWDEVNVKITIHAQQDGEMTVRYLDQYTNFQTEKGRHYCFTFGRQHQE